MEIYLFDYNVREGLSEKQAVAWVPFLEMSVVRVSLPISDNFF
jgi:hypothetical protein